MIIAHITGATITVYTLAGVGVIAIIIIAAVDALIAVLAHHAIGRVCTATFVGAERAGLALTESTQRFVGVIALEVTLAIAADISIG